jgi:multidrug efflux pump subunit AcrA (membrane-fusion protein)
VKIDLFDGKGKPFGPSILQSGVFGKARFPVGEKQLLKVPQRAIFQRGQLTGVFIVDSTDMIRLRLIKTGKPYGDQLEVLSGLNDGDRIVVEGVERVKDGDRVQSFWER